MSSRERYLQRYVRRLRFLDAQRLTPDDERALPSTWRALLALSEEARVHRVLEWWSPFVDVLPQTIGCLKNKLRAVHLLETERGSSLLYELHNKDSDTAFYEGLAPREAIDDPRVREVFVRTPIELQQFFRTLHNGWNYFASRSMGLSPLNHWFMMDQYDWGLLDDIGPSPIDLGRSLAVFTNGMGGYVCFEFLNDATRAHLWFAKQAPRLNVDFWAVVDTWTLLGLEQ